MATATIGKWGNASAVRIPQALLEQVGLAAGCEVRLVAEGARRIVIEPKPERWTLASRMREWDGERYRSPELDWGEPKGREVW